MFKSWFIALTFMLFITASLYSATKNNKKHINKIQEYVYIEDGMRHHLVMNKTVDKFGKVTATVIDTIQHANVSDPAEPWDTGIQDFLSAGDTVANWYTLASDEAQILEIHASFATTGTGSWNVWPRGERGPNTAEGFLLLNVPWTITTVNAIEGVPTGDWQVYDLEESGLAADLTGPGVYVGYFTDGSNGPFMYMDNGGHDVDDLSWRPALAYLSDLTQVPAAGWYFWWVEARREYTEFVQRIVVCYENVAPIISNISEFNNTFPGNTTNNTVSADIIDLDGTVNAAQLKWSVGLNGLVFFANMSSSGGDTFSADFPGTFNAADTVYYWVEATDNEGNERVSGSRNFYIVPPPVQGMDYLLVSDESNLGAERFEANLNAIGAQYFTWDVQEHGGISGHEINFLQWTVIWTGFGSSNLPDPFGDDPHPIRDLLDNGGNLLIVDNDYLFIYGFESNVVTPLNAGDFAYDYLGLSAGASDPPFGETQFFGHAEDPIGGAYTGGLNIFPDFWGVWSDNTPEWQTDWQDLLIPSASANPVFYNDFYDPVGNLNSAIRITDGNFATAFFAFSVETAGNEDFQNILANTLGWMQSVNPTSLKKLDNSLPQSFALQQNYPNPFNPSTTINFSIPNAVTVKIEIFNNLGQSVNTLLNETLSGGSYSTSWNGLDYNNKALSSGVYYYKMSAGDHFAFKKMLLIK